jgi:hypothetical protein
MQLSIFEPLSPTVQPKVPKGATIQERFLAFHRANPHVYRALRHLALNLKRAGHARYSIKGLFEVLRFDYSVRTASDDGFKLNNNLSALYAHKLMRVEPELRHFFAVRKRRTM